MAEADRLLKEASSLDPKTPVVETKVRKQRTKKVNVT
jgi:hypothetical protein